MDRKFFRLFSPGEVFKVGEPRRDSIEKVNRTHKMFHFALHGPLAPACRNRDWFAERICALFVLSDRRAL